MGYGDWLHWTSIVRDLYININNFNTTNEKIKYIKKLISIYNNFKNYGVTSYTNNDNKTKFKVFIIKKKINKQQEEIFYDNPYITNDENYPNYIKLKVTSQDYYSKKLEKFYDDQHVVSRYCKNIGLEKFNISCELYFTKDEIKKIENLIPKDDFILIQPCDYKKYGRYPFGKFQEIVNKLHHKILFLQDGPSKFANKNTKLLKNTRHLIGKTTYREGILLMKYAKLCLVSESGLSIGSNTVNAKTIAIYNATFRPIMTNYDNVYPIHIADENHFSCGVFTCCETIQKKYPNGCLKCKELFANHNTDIIVRKIEEILKI